MRELNYDEALLTCARADMAAREVGEKLVARPVQSLDYGWTIGFKGDSPMAYKAIMLASASMDLPVACYECFMDPRSVDEHGARTVMIASEYCAHLDREKLVAGRG